MVVRITEKARVRHGKHFCVIRHSSLLADYLRLAIKEKRVSYRELARRSGEQISASTVGDILKGKNANPTIEIVLALAKGLGEPADRVFAAACGVPEPEEPEGFKESKFWKLFEAYRGIVKDIHRKMIEDHIEDLVDIIDALPKNADGIGNAR